MSQETFEIRAISGHAGSVPGAGVRREFEVCKLIDTTTCIGCKACEVACLEWNGLSFSETSFDNSYQTMPETAWNYWNLIKFNEHEREDGSVTLLMRKDQCMHCEELTPCCVPCGRHCSVCEWHRGFPAGTLHRLRLPYHCVSFQFSSHRAESFLKSHLVQ